MQKLNKKQNRQEDISFALIMTTCLPFCDECGPVDLDDSFEEEEDTDHNKNGNENENEANIVVTMADSIATPGNLVGIDKLQDNKKNEKKNFEKVLKHHEDPRTEEFLAAKTEHYHTIENELYNLSISLHVIDDTLSELTSSSLDTFGFEIDENDKNFEKILKHHEDQHTEESLAARTEKHSDTIENGSYNHPIGSYGEKDTTTVNTSSSLDTFGFVVETRTHAPISIADDDAPLLSNTPSAPSLTTIKNHIDEMKALPDILQNVMSSNSLDMFGYPADNDAAKITTCPSHNDTHFTARRDLHQHHQQQESSLESRPHSRAAEGLSRSTSKNEDYFMTSSSKARKLQSLRLRGNTINDKNAVGTNYIQRPDQELRVVQEKAKDSCADTDYPGYFGKVIRIQTSEWRDISCQSVVSEITSLSDKLPLQTCPESESKLENMNSIFVCTADREKGATDIMTCREEVEYHKRMTFKESQRRNGKESPLYFDASVKTPPRCYLDPKIQVQLKERNEVQEISVFRYRYSDELKWDDVSSIGLLGVETINHRSTPRKAKSSDNHTSSISMIPFAIQPCPKAFDDSDDSTTGEERRNRNTQTGIFRRRVCLVESNVNNNEGQSEASFAFSTLWGEGTSMKEGRKTPWNGTPGLELIPTFSTVLVEDHDSYCSNLAVEDMNDLETKNEVSTFSFNLLF